MTTLSVVMRKGNQAGYRAGLRLTLEADTARKFVERGWADPVEEPKPEAKRKQDRPRAQEKVL